MQNPAEIAGMVEAHLMDAVALCDHFSWFEGEMMAGKRITEVDLDIDLTGRRAKMPGFRDCSFPTIAGTLHVPLRVPAQLYEFTVSMGAGLAS